MQHNKKASSTLSRSPLRHRTAPFAWQSLSLAFSHGQPWSSHAWHPSPPSGLSHAPSQPWPCESIASSAHDTDHPEQSTYVLNQCSLVLEGVTLAQVVELVVQVLVDLAAGTILDEKTAENTETALPDDLAVELSEYVRMSPP